MFFNIFKNEISYWLDRPAFYVYSLIFLFIAVMTSKISQQQGDP